MQGLQAGHPAPDHGQAAHTQRVTGSVPVTMACTAVSTAPIPTQAGHRDEPAQPGPGRSSSGHGSADPDGGVGHGCPGW